MKKETSLAVKYKDDVIVKLGFFPLEFKEKLLVVKDIANDRELHFELENKVFKEEAISDTKIEIPSNVRKVLSETEGDIFDSYSIVSVQDEEQEEKVIDPFILGYYKGQAYLVTSWGHYMESHKRI